MKKLWLIERTDKWGYDDYDMAVVCAETEENAKLTHPDGESEVIRDDSYDSWAKYEEIKVSYLGEADESVGIGVVCASFNAG
jgi:hypothetical protein